MLLAWKELNASKACCCCTVTQKMVHQGPPLPPSPPQMLLLLRLQSAHRCSHIWSLLSGAKRLIRELLMQPIRKEFPRKNQVKSWQGLSSPLSLLSSHPPLPPSGSSEHGNTALGVDRARFAADLWVQLFICLELKLVPLSNLGESFAGSAPLRTHQESLGRCTEGDCAALERS